MSDIEGRDPKDKPGMEYRYDRCLKTLDWRQCWKREGHTGPHENSSGQQWKDVPHE